MTKKQIAKAVKDNPDLNSTELAIKLVGKGNNPRDFICPEYYKIHHTINDIKAGR